jgi:hypothetical protein
MMNKAQIRNLSKRMERRFSAMNTGNAANWVMVIDYLQGEFAKIAADCYFGPRQAITGKTLADFANSDKLFKRPMHAKPHGFTARDSHLKEIRTSDWQGQHNVCADFPRLTREDLTATDWEEVAGEV